MKKELHIFKILTAVLFFVFLSGSLYSQKVISSVSVNKSATAVSKQLTKNIAESELKQLKSENWMSNKSYLDINSSSESMKLKMLMNEKVFEADNEIENWMTDQNYWELKNSEYNDIDDSSNDIEDWMLDDDFWILKEEEDQSNIENWMIDNKFWVLVK